MSSSQTLKINFDRCDNAFVVIFFKTRCNKTIIIRFGFGDIRNNQGRGKCYQPKPKAIVRTNDYLLITHVPAFVSIFDNVYTVHYNTASH